MDPIHAKMDWDYPQKLSAVFLKFPPSNKRSKNGEIPVKSRVYSIFSVEKTVESVKSLSPFSPFLKGERGEIPHLSTDDGKNFGGKVDKTVENVQNA